MRWRTSVLVETLILNFQIYYVAAGVLLRRSGLVEGGIFVSYHHNDSGLKKT